MGICVCVLTNITVICGNVCVMQALQLCENVCDASITVKWNWTLKSQEKRICLLLYTGAHKSDCSSCVIMDVTNVYMSVSTGTAPCIYSIV